MSAGAVEHDIFNDINDLKSSDIKTFIIPAIIGLTIISIVIFIITSIEIAIYNRKLTKHRNNRPLPRIVITPQDKEQDEVLLEYKSKNTQLQMNINRLSRIRTIMGTISALLYITSVILITTDKPVRYSVPDSESIEIPYRDKRSLIPSINDDISNTLLDNAKRYSVTDDSIILFLSYDMKNMVKVPAYKHILKAVEKRVTGELLDKIRNHKNYY
ncbi:hypothetical protein NEIRO03_0967 [Nematocida sp. AWRm78]|nr:hypothetical protein NEIRO02_1022 [Nematocida sp. AWRm79]KAI5183370.1 hypothetical protein NEIRO03_0967 [Nematocida sp. AWRm78]